MVTPEKSAMPSTTCTILESGKWHAWLDTYQQEKGFYRLNISGEVRLANPGYDLEWAVGPTDRMEPPGLNLFLSAVSKEGMHAQVITDVSVNYEMNTPISSFRHVSIVCGDKLLGQMVDVQLTD